MMRLACFAMSFGILSAGPALADTITLNPTMIANVQSGPGQNDNNGGGFLLIQPSNDNNQGLLSFNLASMKVPVAGATLKIYQTALLGNGGAEPGGFPNASAGSYDIYSNTSTWQQNTVTWNTKPSVDPASVATLPLRQYTSGWRSWNVTSLVNAWITGQQPNFGLTIAESDPGTPSVWLITGQILPGAPDTGGPGAIGEAVALYPPELILDTNAVAPAPEPASLVMAVSAALGLIGYRRYRTLGLVARTAN